MIGRTRREDLENIEDWNLSEVALAAADQIDQGRQLEGRTELNRRAAQAQIDSTKAQQRMVQSAGWSVIFMAVMAFLSALFQFLSWYYPRIPH
jgi:hypothetical protein